MAVVECDASPQPVFEAEEVAAAGHLSWCKRRKVACCAVHDDEGGGGGGSKVGMGCGEVRDRVCVGTKACGMGSVPDFTVLF